MDDCADDVTVFLLSQGFAANEGCRYPFLHLFSICVTLDKIVADP